MLGEQATSIASLRRKLVDVEEQLEKAVKDVAEKDAKARSCGLGAAQMCRSLTVKVRHRPAACPPHPLPPSRRVQIKGMEEVMHHSQSYSSTLQSYNTTLQADLNSEKGKREEVGVLRDALQGQVAELSGRLKGAEERLQFDQVGSGAVAGEGGEKVACRSAGVRECITKVACRSERVHHT